MITLSIIRPLTPFTLPHPVYSASLTLSTTIILSRDQVRIFYPSSDSLSFGQFGEYKLK